MGVFCLQVQCERRAGEEREEDGSEMEQSDDEKDCEGGEEKDDDCKCECERE